MRIPLLTAPVIAGCLFLTAPNNTEAPGPQNFRRLYGEHTMERFAAPPGITVTVQYGPDRLACELLIEGQHLLFEVKGAIAPYEFRSGIRDSSNSRTCRHEGQTNLHGQTRARG